MDTNITEIFKKVSYDNNLSLKDKWLFFTIIWLQLKWDKVDVDLLTSCSSDWLYANRQAIKILQDNDYLEVKRLFWGRKYIIKWLESTTTTTEQTTATTEPTPTPTAKPIIKEKTEAEIKEQKEKDKKEIEKMINAQSTWLPFDKFPFVKKITTELYESDASYWNATYIFTVNDVLSIESGVPIRTKEIFINGNLRYESAIWKDIDKNDIFYVVPEWNNSTKSILKEDEDVFMMKAIIETWNRFDFYNEAEKSVKLIKNMVEFLSDKVKYWLDADEYLLLVYTTLINNSDDANAMKLHKDFHSGADKYFDLFKENYKIFEKIIKS